MSYVRPSSATSEAVTSSVLHEVLNKVLPFVTNTNPQLFKKEVGTLRVAFTDHEPGLHGLRGCDLNHRGYVGCKKTLKEPFFKVGQQFKVV